MICKFKKPVFLMDEITVTTKILEFKKHSLLFKHTIKNNFEGLIVFEGSSKVICTEENNKLFSTLPDYISKNLIKERINSESCCI